MTNFKKMIVTFIIACTVFVHIGTSNSVYADDLDGREFETEMREMVVQKILAGYPDGTYKPTEKVTRGQFAAFIERALNLPKGTGSFKDVSSNVKLKDSIIAVSSAGIMRGHSNNLFKPNDYISREQMALTMQAVVEYSGMPLNTANIVIADRNAFTSSQFAQAVFTGLNYSYLNNEHFNKTTRFEPKADTTREQSAGAIARFLTAKKAYELENGGTIPVPPVKPPVENKSYQLAMIQNGKLVKTGKTYSKYEDAAKLFNENATKNIEAMYRGEELIRIKSGIAFGSNFAVNAAGKKVPAVTTMYESHSGTTFTKQVAYIEHGREMRYIDANADAVKVQIGATIGWVKHSEVDFIPLRLLKNREYYVKNQYGTLEHFVYNHQTNTRASYSIGPGAKNLVPGTRYYSYDGVHFNNEHGTLMATDYNYFQFLSVLSKTNYNAAELEGFIKKILVGRESTGLAKYKDATKKSKLLGTAKYMIEMQEKHKVNALFILAAAIHESDYGVSNNAQTKNNLFGIRVYDSAPEQGLKFPKPEDSIQSFVLDYLIKNYIPPTALHANGAAPGNKTSGFNVKYASDPNWGSKIAGHMFRIDIELGRKDIHKEKLIITSYPGSINVRSAPDTTKNNIIFKYPARILGYANDLGNPLVVIEEKKGADGYLWYKVLSDHPSFENGWIREDLVTVISN